MSFRSLYFFILAGDLIALTFREQYPIGEYIFKPALMISLATYFYQTMPKQQSSIDRNHSHNMPKQDYLILAALIFSCLGDIALMFKDGFLPGLSFFLIAHVLYIIAFLYDNKGFIFSKIDRLLWSVIILAAGVGLILYLLPHLGQMSIPVVIYAITILTMLLTTLNRWKSVNNSSFQWVFLGASLFVISDSMIAISRFVQPFIFSGSLIMLTYALGQYLIVMGYLKRND